MEKQQYNEEPVYYCKHCLSLFISNIPRLENSDYCGKCGSTNIGQCNIEEWEQLYKERYGHKFTESNY